MQKEDFFLKQIDEFKEKAKYLQSLLTTKESKVEELEGVLEAKEEKAKELQGILDGHKEESDRITQGVKDQVDALISRVDAQMRVMDEAISNEINTLQEQISEQVVEINSNSRQGMAELDKKIQDFSQSATEQLEKQTESMKVMLEGSMKETLEQISAELAKMSADVEKVADAVKDNSGNEQKLEEVKTELGEKIHRENVKCYRNIQTLLEELENKIERVEVGTQSMKVIQSYFGVLIILGIVNFGGIIAIIAHMFGFF